MTWNDIASVVVWFLLGFFGQQLIRITIRQELSKFADHMVSDIKIRLIKKMNEEAADE